MNRRFGPVVVRRDASTFGYRLGFLALAVMAIVVVLFYEPLATVVFPSSTPQEGSARELPAVSLPCIRAAVLQSARLEQVATGASQAPQLQSPSPPALKAEAERQEPCFGTVVGKRPRRVARSDLRWNATTTRLILLAPHDRQIPTIEEVRGWRADARLSSLLHARMPARRLRTGFVRAGTRYWSSTRRTSGTPPLQGRSQP